ncbi:hypothetical protein D9V32_00445 [Mycetocola tolaasinivorans]|uniref:Uncharacterized protein n=1 Tax=Mycetocola tolaasinivorans TaxID=76635 RepID=A0A3L7ADW8_9MICO|nr:hypothetical protein D9V32_00445 [Mycetocola tolaasinivorans]
MVKRQTRQGILGSFIVATVLVTSGCAPERLTEDREYEVDQLSLEFKALGDQLIAQIAPAELKEAPSFNGRGGGMSMDPFDRNGWPRNTGWGASLVIQPEGPRTPVEIKDDLETWLLSQGWSKPELRSSFTRKGIESQGFVRGDEFLLRVEASTDPPPRAQRVQLSVRGPDVN